MTHAGALRQDEAAFRPNSSLLIVLEHVLLGNGVIGAAPVGSGQGQSGVHHGICTKDSCSAQRHGIGENSRNESDHPCVQLEHSGDKDSSKHGFTDAVSGWLCATAYHHTQ